MCLLKPSCQPGKESLKFRHSRRLFPSDSLMGWIQLHDKLLCIHSAGQPLIPTRWWCWWKGKKTSERDNAAVT